MTAPKPRLDLISGEALWRVGLRMAEGVKDHPPWPSKPRAEYWQSLLRHVVQEMQGDHSEDHLAAIICNAQTMIEIDARRIATLAVNANKAGKTNMVKQAIDDFRLVSWSPGHPFRPGQKIHHRTADGTVEVYQADGKLMIKGKRKSRSSVS